MADAKIAFDLVSPERLLLSEDAEMVTIPGMEGEMGGMGGGMESEHGGPASQFFPSLMNLPKLNANQRAQIEQAAQQRIA